MWEVMELSQEYIDAFADTTFVNSYIDENVYTESLEVVKFMSKRRKQKALANWIITSIDEWKSNSEVMSKVNKFFELEEIIDKDTNDVQEEILNEVLHLVQIKRFLTWYDDLDTLLWGFVPNQLITVGARPWRWKSMFAVSTIVTQLRKWYRIAFFSLEMSEKEILQRLYSNLWDLDLNIVKWIYLGELSDENKKKLNSAMEEYDNYKDTFFIYDDLYSLPLIANKIRILWMKKAVDVIYIDYLWLIESKAETRNLEISKITRSLKILAMTYWIPIVVLAQLNRWVDEDDAPSLSSLRDSWSIEQDSDVVLMIQRTEWENMHIYVRKNRNWPIWELELKCIPQYMQLWNATNPF